MTSEGRTKLKGDGDDGLMDYAPGKVLGTEELGSIRVSRRPHPWVTLLDHLPGNID